MQGRGGSRERAPRASWHVVGRVARTRQGKSVGVARTDNDHRVASAAAAVAVAVTFAFASFARIG